MTAYLGKSEGIEQALVSGAAGQDALIIQPAPGFDEDASVTPEIVRESGLRAVINRARYAADSAIVGLEISPANEAARGAVFAYSQTLSSNPVVGALAYGGATLAIETTAAVAAADLFSSGRGKQVADKVRSRIERFIPEGVTEIPTIAEYSIGLVGGSAVAVASQEVVVPSQDRSFSDRLRYGMGNVLRVTGVCAVQGAAMTEGIHSPSPLTIGAAVGALGGGLYAAKKGLARWNNGAEDLDVSAENEGIENRWMDHNPESNTTYMLVDQTSGPETVADALSLEQLVWDKKNYGNAVVEYADYEEQSRIFVATKPSEVDSEVAEVVGVVRVFEGSPQAPPFTELPFYSAEQHEQILAGCSDGKVEELATSAMDDTKANAAQDIAALWRLAYREARDRGVEQWGIIMEPERVRVLNRYYGFTFEQMGPTEYYQGGDCAAHIMDFGVVEQNLADNKPARYQSFILDPLTRPSD